LWQQGGNFTARLDWGIPLVTVAGNQDTLQENGIYFSLGYIFF
jgi:hemolysin activation/secretion protein